MCRTTWRPSRPGLAATIREWFSEGENVTTVETAEKVDLDEVRVKRRLLQAEEAQVAVEPEVEEDKCRSWK